MASPTTSENNLGISEILEAIRRADPSFVPSESISATEVSLEPVTAGGELNDVEWLRQEPVVRKVRKPKIQPYIEIVEQPAEKTLRFRYESEGRSVYLTGANSTNEHKTYPGIKIVGFKGRAVVVVSCVTEEQPYFPHPHQLVDKNDEFCKEGVCTKEVPRDTMTVYFDRLGIQCVKKTDVKTALKLREKIKVDPFRTGFDYKGPINKSYLSNIRLCFQAFLLNPATQKFTIPLQAVVSNPIRDKKANSELVICKLSHCSASVTGGTEMILLCEKVNSKDIEVRFFELRNEQLYWEGFGVFNQNGVHKQMAITFRTPSYISQRIDQPVNAFIQLRRPSDGELSEPHLFQFIPLDQSDFYSLKRKRQKLNNNPKAYLLKQLQAEATKQSSESLNQLPPFHLVNPANILPLFEESSAEIVPSNQFQEIINESQAKININEFQLAQPSDSYNIVPTESVQDLASQLEPSALLSNPAMDIMPLDSLVENDVINTNFDLLDDSNILANAIGNAMIIDNITEDQQQLTINSESDFINIEVINNISKNLTFSEIVKDAVSVEEEL